MKIKEFETRLQKIKLNLQITADVNYNCGCNDAYDYVKSNIKDNVTESGHIKQRRLQGKIKEYTKAVENCYVTLIPTKYIKGYNDFLTYCITECFNNKETKKQN